MAADDGVRGRFVWYELMTTDPDAAKRFYTDVVGWGTQEYPGGQQPYTLWTAGEAQVGGLMAVPEEARGTPPNWMLYIGTPNVDETVERARQLGATVYTGPMDIPEIGRFAVLADPQGASFAAFTPSGPPPESGSTPQTGTFSWHELLTTDHEAAFAFYSELFGWRKTEAMDMGPLGVYQMYGRGDQTLGGMYNKTPDMPGPPAWLAYVMVPDVEKVAEKVRARGGQVINGPMEIPGGDWIVAFLDPQGAALAAHEKRSKG